MTARSVLLAMAAASFLRGDEPLNTGSDGRTGSTETGGFGGKVTSLSQRWRECDQQAQLTLASANPQVEKHENRVSLHMFVFLLVSWHSACKLGRQETNFYVV